MKVFVFCLLLCLPVWVMGASKHAPVPESVVNAKTVFILNQTGIQKIEDAAYGDLGKWGRFKVVSDRKSADLIVHFVSRDAFFKGTSRPEVSMFVTTPDSDDPLYQNTPGTHFTWAAVTNSSVNSFRKWIEGR